MTVPAPRPVDVVALATCRSNVMRGRTRPATRARTDVLRRQGHAQMRSTSRPTRWGPRLLLRAALVGVLLTLSVGVMAAPAQAATINCTPMGDPACKDLAPIVECIWSNGDGTNTIALGLRQPERRTRCSSTSARKNKMAPGADDQGQPTVFTPGMHHNAFVTTVSGNRTWTLGQQQGRLRLVDARLPDQAGLRHRQRPGAGPRHRPDARHSACPSSHPAASAGRCPA